MSMLQSLIPLLLFLFFGGLTLALAWAFLRSTRLDLHPGGLRVNGRLETRVLGLWVVERAELVGVRGAQEEYRTDSEGRRLSRIVLQTATGPVPFGQLYTNVPKAVQMHKILDAMASVQNTGQAATVRETSMLAWGVVGISLVLTALPALVVMALQVVGWVQERAASPAASSAAQGTPSARADPAPQQPSRLPDDFPPDASRADFCDLYQVSFQEAQNAWQYFGKTTITPVQAKQRIQKEMGAGWALESALQQPHAVALTFRKGAQRMEYVVTEKDTCVTTWTRP